MTAVHVSEQEDGRHNQEDFIMTNEKLEQLIDAVMTAHDSDVAAAERALFAALGVNPDDPAVMEAFLVYDSAVAKMWRQAVQVAHDRAAVVALGALNDKRLVNRTVIGVRALRR